MTTRPTAIPAFDDLDELWWTTSGTSSFLTSAGSTFVTSGGSTFLTTNSAAPSAPISPTSTSDSSASITSPPASVPTSLPPGSLAPSSSLSSSSSSFGPGSVPSNPTGIVAAQNGPVCLGQGIDASGGGILATLIIPSIIGILLWLLFAFLRPRFRQVYGLREWFLRQDLRPHPLSNSFWAFLFPHVPLVPSVPKDVSDAGHSPVTDAELFPSDEQLSQRTLWTSLLIVLGWSFIGLVGGLPLYLVDTTCLAQTTPRPQLGGAYSTLQDLSLLRLLQRLDSDTANAQATFRALHTRAASGSGGLSNARIRIIILTVIVIVFAVIPALWKLLHEFSRLAAYRRRWVEVRCEGKEMGWLSARLAPGFEGWGEKRLKQFILKTGLSSTLDTTSGGGRDGVARDGRRRHRIDDLSHAEEDKLEVDVQALFSITNTGRLARLINERDEILENLEIAETKYIYSFRVTTPDPSIADFQPVPQNDGARPYISRPKPLTGTMRPKRGRAYNPAYGSTSFTPNSYVLPSQYYKLRRIEGVSSTFGDSASAMAAIPEPTLGDTIAQRVVGTRFQEVHTRNSVVWGKLPLGSQVRMDKEGRVSAVPTSEIIPDPTRYGPNHGLEEPSESADHQGETDFETTGETGPDEGWVDVLRDQRTPDGAYLPIETGSADQPGVYDAAAAQPLPRRPKIWDYPASHRSTFPMRPTRYSELDQTQAPPHLRLQQRQPFVRPLTGLDHDDLGEVYADISHWRGRLKVINAEIADVQQDGYADIAEGTRIKGWLLVGRGIRFVPGVRMIEGRAKEDVRWSELQHEGDVWNKVVMWLICLMTALALAIGLTAVAGLALGTAPDVTNYLPFFKPLANSNDWISGLATCLGAAVAASLFISAAVAIVHYATRLSTAVSISAFQLTSFKITFWMLTLIGFVWLTAVGAIVFSIPAFEANSQGTRTVANGAIYMSELAFALVINVAIISPALLLLQPFRLWHVTRAERDAITPRQRFRAVYPGTYNPTFAAGCCILAVVIASTFALLFPLIGPAVVLLVFLTLIAHRFLIGYVYARTHSQTGGLLQLWILRRFATLVALQPLVLGLILLTRRLWEEGGVLCGTAVVTVVIAEVFCWRKMRQPGVLALSAISRNSIETFSRAANPRRRKDDEENTDLVSDSLGAGTGMRTRGSFASVLEMMSLTLAVMPGPSTARGPVPLPTETLDDLTATERAARTHPDAPPHLPALPFADHAEEMAGILYAPELIAPPPIIWLPNDASGVARSEAYDLQRYHELAATLDVRAKEDVVALGLGRVRSKRKRESASGSGHAATGEGSSGA